MLKCSLMDSLKDKEKKEDSKDPYADLPPWPYEEGTYGLEGCGG